jgi:ribonuclease BN (tRNA processing enzyme)
LEVLGVLEMFRRCYRDTIPFDIECREVAPREEFLAAGMTVTGYPMVHCGSIEGHGIMEPIPAMGYRLWYGGETVAISGDTGDCPELRELIEGADLAILEATNKHRTDVSEEELAKVHLSEDLAIEIGQSAKDYMLIHQGG